MRTGVYPGTFDPITLGHMDIIRRGVHLVDQATEYLGGFGAEADLLRAIAHFAVERDH